MIRPAAHVAPAASPAPVDPALRKAAQAFEAVMLRQVIGTMRNARLAEEMFGSNATSQFREMADARTADNMAQMGRFGIAAMVERQLTKNKDIGQ
jgi:peptidoglycan hydrolase FlgJ